MTVLRSRDGSETIELKPYGLERGDAQWALTRLVLRAGSAHMEVSGPFLMVAELVRLIEGIRGLTRCGARFFTLEPTEPNCQFSINEVGAGQFEVKIKYLKTFDYEEGRIIDTTRGFNSMVLRTDGEALEEFAQQLEEHMRGLANR